VIALALALALVHEEPTIETRVEPQVSTWVELDTNARRLPSGKLDEDDDGFVPPELLPEVPVPDGLVRLQGLLAAELREPGLLLRSDTAVGGKAFFTQTSESMAVAQTRASLTSTRLPGGLGLAVSALAKGRAQLSGVRSYGLFRGDAVVEHAALPFLALRAGGNGQAFHAFDLPIFSLTGANLVVGARAAAGPESADVQFELGARGYPYAPRRTEAIADPRLDDGKRRSDGLATASVQLVSSRKLFLSGSYLWMRNASNARGESFTRHRLSALVGFRLPSMITCTAQGTVQITAYDDGVSVGQAYFLGDDEDSQNVLDVTLSRPVGAGFFVEARASFMGNELAVEGARFSRQTAALGVRATFE
jgi:hypothetical protein